MLDKLSLILKSSSKITIEPEYRRFHVSPLKYGSVKGRIAYFFMALLNVRDVISMTQQNVSRLEHLVEKNPEAIPSVFWPYQCSNWSTSNRLEYLHNHFQTLPELDYQFTCQEHHKRTIACLDGIYPGMSLVVDRNGHFLREGMIVLNLFVDQERVFTLAFSVYKDKCNSIGAIVGAIQGRRMKHITDLYRDITKTTYGIRPRDLMIEVFQVLCRVVGIEKIYAVTESFRQHRHYFYMLKDKDSHLSLNYDEVWSQRGGVKCSEEFFELPVMPERKPLDRIIAKKRSMYRKRYSLLEKLEQDILNGIISSACQTV